MNEKEGENGMRISVFAKIRTIAVSNLRHNFLPDFSLSLLLLLLTPFIFGTANVDAKAAAIPLEMFVSLIGIILLTPAFLPEQQENVRNVVESKATPSNCVYGIRICIVLLSMLVLIAAFTFYMKGNGCKFDISAAVFGTFSGSLFLGALGLFAYGLSNTITVGYMVPMVYYMLNLFGGSKYFGKLFLFSMSSGSITEKYWLVTAGMILIAFTLLLKKNIQYKQ
jgi:hypothetical protein